jgi:Glycosyl transferase family 8
MRWPKAQQIACKTGMVMNSAQAIAGAAMPTPRDHDCAVAFCVDRKFFPFALFMIWQIAHLNLDRSFDFVISSQEKLDLPDWAGPFDIVLHRAGEPPPESEAARYHGSMSTVLRIMLARELGDRYRRIIYMDSDMFVEGGDLGRLFDIDLGPHPIGAVLDLPHFCSAVPDIIDYRAVGLPPLPYFNAGFQVIDTRAYQDQEVERRSFDVCKTFPAKILFGDQTLTNLALRGKFAQLAPCWNWILNPTFPQLAHFHPVFHHHFVSQEKPNLVSSTLLPVRFNQAYRDFFRKHFPEALPKLAAPARPRSFTAREQAIMTLNTLQTGHHAEAIIRRFPDPYLARL